MTAAGGPGAAQAGRGATAALPDPATFLSGNSGHVSGLRATVARRSGDLLLDLVDRTRRVGSELDELATTMPPREILVLCVYRPGSDRVVALARELSSTRHRARLAFGSTVTARPELASQTVATDLGGGKFENLNAMLAAAGGAPADWTLVVDDDVDLPPRFLDRLIGLCERFELALAQPAQTLRSHAAWAIARRRPASLLRETRFVEIGPVTAFRRDAAQVLMPFPALRFGWGLDVHWAAIAAEREWRLGIADALPVRHEHQPVASAYGRAEAIAEAQRFLAGRPYLPSHAAQETLATHRRARRR